MTLRFRINSCIDILQIGGHLKKFNEEFRQFKIPYCQISKFRNALGKVHMLRSIC